MPGPLLSVQEKLVLTTCPTAYTPPFSGDNRCAVGGVNEKTARVPFGGAAWTMLVAASSPPCGLNASEYGCATLLSVCGLPLIMPLVSGYSETLPVDEKSPTARLVP